MYFFAFPLLLLFASTIWASPLQFGLPKATKDIIRALEIKTNKPTSGLDKDFYGKDSYMIREWSNDIDQVVADRVTYLQSFNLPRTVIKRTVLSAVQPRDGFTPEQLVFMEIRNFEVERSLTAWQRVEEKVDGKKEVILYIKIHKPGVPALQSGWSQKQLEESMQQCIERLESKKIFLDEKHKSLQYFGFVPRAFGFMLAEPYFLRDATFGGKLPDPSQNQLSESSQKLPESSQKD